MMQSSLRRPKQFPVCVGRPIASLLPLLLLQLLVLLVRQQQLAWTDPWNRQDATATAAWVIFPIAQALYVSYEESKFYKVGDRVPIRMDKLTSPITFAPMDYTEFPLCLTTDSSDTVTLTSSSSQWNEGISTLHGDAYHPLNGASLTFGYDLFCAPVCSFNGWAEPDNGASYLQYIQNGYYYNVHVDGLPAALQSETDETVSVSYWGGIPIGERDVTTMMNSRSSNIKSAFTAISESNVFIYNHWNIQIWYRQSPSDSDLFSIVRVMIEPFSVQQEFSTGQLESCSTDAANPVHTAYDMVYELPPQLFAVNQPFRFTYDVSWLEAPEDVPHNKRWDVYLEMDGAIPNYVEFAGFFLGGFILVAVAGVLLTWVLRDLSYKPIIDHQQEEDGNESTTDASSAQIEIQMWPLSNRIFFPPTHARLLLCVACGTGAQLLTAAFFFIVLFRFGVISQSQGARILTPGIVLFCMSSAIGGYVTARLYAIFHGDFKVALVACLMTAITYPLLGLIVVCIVYDILPLSGAPDYNASSHLSPFIALWICLNWPLTVIGGYFGHRCGPIQNFPVSEGTAGYHDLNLQNDKKELDNEGKSQWVRWNEFTKKYRIPILLLTGGFLPILSCFVNYSYGVAGPTLLRYYSVRPYMISSFLIFNLLSGTEAVLLFYRQIRTQPTYEWWWATFSTASSAGIYIFALSMSYLVFRGNDSDSNLSGFTIVSYMIWFAFVSFGVLLMTGFVGVALNIIFIRTLYTFIMNRQQ